MIPYVKPSPRGAFLAELPLKGKLGGLVSPNGDE